MAMMSPTIDAGSAGGWLGGGSEGGEGGGATGGMEGGGVSGGGDVGGSVAGGTEGGIGAFPTAVTMTGTESTESVPVDSGVLANRAVAELSVLMALVRAVDAELRMLALITGKDALMRTDAAVILIIALVVSAIPAAVPSVARMAAWSAAV